jgi:hypothetical protein
MTSESKVIGISPVTPAAKGLWAKTLELAESFGAEERWSLIGGLMVQLHAFERGGGSRPTADIDVLGDSRRRPPVTARIAEILVERGAKMTMPPVGDENLGYRFELEGEVIEVVGSEGVRRDPKTLGKYTTFQVPGGSQALSRTEIVRVSLDGNPPVELRRPSLLGAILIKARAVAARRDRFDSDRQDLIRLLSFVHDPRALAEEERLRTTEKRWLRDIEPLIAFDDAALTDALPAGDVGRARQAYRLLIA